jgi:hypothetical protein
MSTWPKPLSLLLNVLKSAINTFLNHKSTRVLRQVGGAQDIQSGAPVLEQSWFIIPLVARVYGNYICEIYTVYCIPCFIRVISYNQQTSPRDITKVKRDEHMYLHHRAIFGI